MPPEVPDCTLTTACFCVHGANPHAFDAAQIAENAAALMQSAVYLVVYCDAEMRGVLGKLLFSGDAGLKLTETLSGGEAARLLLAKILLLKNNVVLLDEPTNHLDVESIDALLQALLEFKGTVVVTSHDRHFVGKLATRILSLTAKGQRLFSGTYDEFLERHGDEVAHG